MEKNLKKPRRIKDTHEAEKLTDIEIGNWINSRFVRYNLADYRHDFCGFPLGVITQKYGDISNDYMPHNFLKEAYVDGNSLFKGRFENILRNNLEQRITNLDNFKRIEDIKYVHYGETLVGCADISPLSNLLVRLTQPRYDFDFESVLLEDKSSNLYIKAIRMLHMLTKPNISIEFWDKFLDDNRINEYVISPLSISPIEGIGRISQYFNKLSEDRAEHTASQLFYFYFNKAAGIPPDLLELKQAVDEIKTGIVSMSPTDKTSDKLLGILRYCAGSELLMSK